MGRDIALYPNKPYGWEDKVIYFSSSDRYYAGTAFGYTLGSFPSGGDIHYQLANPDRYHGISIYQKFDTWLQNLGTDSARVYMGFPDYSNFNGTISN